jgi:hypothetical protein
MAARLTKRRKSFMVRLPQYLLERVVGVVAIEVIEKPVAELGEGKKGCGDEVDRV